MQLAAITTAPLATPTPAPTPAPAAPARPLVQAGAPEQIGRQLVGMNYADARAAVQELGVALRVTIEDGQPQIVTMDWNPSRINVAVEGEKITSFEGLG